MKRFVVVENPPKSRAVPAFRPVVFTRGRAQRNVMPLPVTTALNRPKRRKARKNVMPLPVTTALNPVTDDEYKWLVARAKRAKKGNDAWLRRMRGVGPAKKRKKTTKKKSAGVPRARNRRGNANRGGSKMATAKQRAAQRKFVARFAGKKSRKKKGRRARQNRRGRPLSGRSYRPTLPKGPLRVIVKTVKAKYKKTLGRASKAGKKRAAKRRKSAVRRPRSRAKKNPVYTVFNNGRKRGKRLSASRARAMSMKRWHGKRSKSRRARRNFGGGIISAFKSALSVKTAKSGLAVLAGAIVATGAPSLFGSYNSGWMGIGLSILTAAGAAAVATMVAPAFLVEVASGGIVVVGLNLVAQFFPKALSWQSAIAGKGLPAGFLLPARNASVRSGVGGYLPPPPGAVSLVGRGRVSGFARAAGEGFKSPRI